MLPRRALPLALVLLACGGSVAKAPPAATAKETAAVAPIEEPCPASMRMLRALRGPMRIEAHVANASQVRTVLERYRRASDGKLAFDLREEKDASDAPALVVTYGGEQASAKSLPTEHPEQLELAVLSSVSGLVDRVHGTKRAIGVLTGHGERRLDAFDLVSVPARGEQASIAGIIEKYFPTFHFVDVDLAGGERDVDPALDALVIVQPSADLSEKELHALDAFVMRGKSLLVAASAVNVPRDSTSRIATVGAHGLDRLLAGYGITLNEDVVIDFGDSFTLDVRVQSSSSTTKLRFPHIPRPTDATLDTAFPAFFRIPELALPYASSVAVRPSAQPNARVRVVARTSPRATVVKRPYVELSIVQRWTVPHTFDQFGLAAASEGTLKSAFGTATSARSARVLLVASASAFANPFVGPRGTVSELEDQLSAPYAQRELTSTLLVLRNTLDWMTADDDLAACVR